MHNFAISHVKDGKWQKKSQYSSMRMLPKAIFTELQNGSLERNVLRQNIFAFDKLLKNDICVAEVEWESRFATHKEHELQQRCGMKRIRWRNITLTAFRARKLGLPKTDLIHTSYGNMAIENCSNFQVRCIFEKRHVSDVSGCME